MHLLTCLYDKCFYSLEFAENLDRRVQDVLSRQELRVERIKMKFNQVKELVSLTIFYISGEIIYFSS